MHGTLVPTLFAVAGLLALVSLVPPIARRFRLPLAVLLAMAGVTLGSVNLLLGSGTADRMGAMGDFLLAVEGLELSSAGFLFIFLPILLFEASIGIDVRRLSDDLWPILLLAIVAVVACTALAGGAMWAAWYLWHGEWSAVGLVACLMLASIIATTDPAAVIGIFRDVGAPRRLTSLVEGESLFNDAAAIAIFSILLGLLTGGVGEAGMPTVEAGLNAFLIKFFGGILVGWILGWIVALVVTPLRDLPHSEISLTVALAYLAFIVAETYLHVSGVVAVVVAGLVIGSVGRTRISPESWDGMSHIWTQLGFWANSLIFILASMLVPPTLMEATRGHLLLLAALILGATAARALVIFGMIPLLTFLGAADRISGGYKAVMLWGGLRGAVSLALALAVTENRLVATEIKQLVGVAATGYVLFTLFVQGLTLRPLIRLLGLDRLSPVERALRNRALGLSLAQVREEVEAVAGAFDLKAEPAVARLVDRGAEIAQEQVDLEASGALTAENRVYIGLSTLALYEEQAYRRYFADGIIPRSVAEALQTGVGRLQDGLKVGGPARYEGVARDLLRLRRTLRRALWLQRRIGWASPLAGELSNRFGILVVVRFCLRELDQFALNRLQRLLGKEATDELRAILARRAAMVDEAIEALRLQYPAYVDEVQSRYLQRASLRFEQRMLRTLEDEGTISAEIVADLFKEIEWRRQELERPPRLDLGLSTEDLLKRVPLFRELGPDRLARIGTLLKPRLTVPEEFVVRRGDRGDAVFFIASGAVSVVAPGLDQAVRLGTGDVFGELALLLDQPRNADVVSLGFCRLLVLDRDDFVRVYNDDADLRQHINDIAARRVPAAS